MSALLVPLVPLFGLATFAPFQPSQAEMLASFERSAAVQRAGAGLVLNERIVPIWIGEDLAYRRQSSQGKGSYVRVSFKTGASGPLFDHTKVAAGLGTLSGTAVEADSLSLGTVTASPDGSSVWFTYREKPYAVSLATSAVSEPPSGLGPGAERGQGPRRDTSTDGTMRARIQQGQIETQRVGSSEWAAVTQAGQFERFEWAPGSHHIVAVRVLPGDRRQVSVLLSTGANRTRAELRTRFYDQPGDRLDQSEVHIVDADAKTSAKVEIPLLSNGGQPWAGPTGITWIEGDKPSFIIRDEVRGYQQVRLQRVWLDGRTQTVLDEKSETFVHVGQMFWRQVAPEKLLFRSERSGWGMMYLLDLRTLAQTPVTSGSFVVRSVVRADDRSVVFMANGREAGDPYFLDMYSVGLDGKNLARLTQGEGTHSVQWSPGGTSFIDTRSSQTVAPVHVWRRGSGGVIRELETADTSALVEAGIKRPEVFVTKGRDGTTDIWGLIYRPSKTEPGKKYPVIENIYAGPHDSHVPKAWQSAAFDQQLAELGFIIVRIDGMGTANRGKKFHDVCWQNIADAGFPDRIAWIKAAAARYPEIDAERVGIFGTSAGGQNAAGALLFQPGFYDVGVASCGCHDNRIDKQWWNEQWMGYPVGPHYAAQSNITNAAKLQGKLMLIVGEVDTNVPPESTYRLVDALQAARKDFEFVYIPGADHTSGGPYGELKRRNFFIRHLHGVEPPSLGLADMIGSARDDVALMASMAGEHGPEADVYSP